MVNQFLNQVGKIFFLSLLESNTEQLTVMKTLHSSESSRKWRMTGKSTSTFWEAVEAVEVEMPGRGATARGHYGHFRAELAKNLPAGAFDDLAGHLKNGHYRAELAKGLPAGEFDALAGHFKKTPLPDISKRRVSRPLLVRKLMSQKLPRRESCCGRRWPRRGPQAPSRASSGKRARQHREREQRKRTSAPIKKRRLPHRRKKGLHSVS